MSTIPQSVYECRSLKKGGKMNGNRGLVKLGEDEFNLVLQYRDFNHINELAQEKGWSLESAWEYIVDMYILDEFLDVSRFEDVLGTFVRAPQGMQAHYDNSIYIPDVPYRITISWHSTLVRSGISIQVHAYAWNVYKNEYKNQYGQEINLMRFLRMVQCSDIYSSRLSRVDFTADYFDFPDPYNVSYIHPSFLFDFMQRRLYQVKNWKGNPSLTLGAHHGDEGRINSFELGMRNRNTKLLIRFYDKKYEQEKKNGFRLQEAMEHNAWMRMECSYRKDYAYQITDILLSPSLKTEEDYIRFIAMMMTEKCRIYDNATDEVISITEELLNIANNPQINHLESGSAWDNDLRRSVQNHASGNSGLFSTLYKIRRVWSSITDADRLVFDKLFEIYRNKYVPLADSGEYPSVDKWLRNHGKETAKMTIDDLF